MEFSLKKPFKKCKRYSLSIWQCPSFLFLLMGLIIIIVMIVTYIIASGYIKTPEIVALIVIILTAILFIIGNAIVSSFNRIAESNIIKTEFISIVSHHLRGPLTSLKWTMSYVDEMKEKYSSEDGEILEMLKKNVGEMAQIINDIVNANLIATDRVKLVYSEVSPLKLTKRAIDKVSSLIEDRDISINLQEKGNIPVKIKADYDKLYICLQNLIDNAVRYIKSKDGKVQIILEVSDSSVKWTITDNGIGIPKSDQKMIFKKFFRSSGAMRYQTSGTGLGLFNAKYFIEAMNGKIGFESEEGKGSSFWFWIPFKSQN